MFFFRFDELDKLLVEDRCNSDSNITYEDHDDQAINWDKMLKFMINVYSVISLIYTF